MNSWSSRNESSAASPFTALGRFDIDRILGLILTICTLIFRIHFAVNSGQCAYMTCLSIHYLDLPHANLTHLILIDIHSVSEFSHGLGELFAFVTHLVVKFFMRTSLRSIRTNWITRHGQSFPRSAWIRVFGGKYVVSAMDICDPWVCSLFTSFRSSDNLCTDLPNLKTCFSSPCMSRTHLDAIIWTMRRSYSGFIP